MAIGSAEGVHGRVSLESARPWVLRAPLSLLPRAVEQAHDDNGGVAPRTVVLVVFDGFQLLDLAGPLDVLAMANRVVDGPAYRLITASPGGTPVAVPGGSSISVDRSLEELAAGSEEIHTLMVIGGDGAFSPEVSVRVAPQLPALARRSRRITSVCAGAALLAAAGLLDGYRATTHWAAAERLAQWYPRVRVEPDQIFVHDRNRWTSAGVTAGIDMALALVEQDLGTDVAQTIARVFVMYVRRGGGQAQYSTQMRTQPARTPAIRAVQQWVPDHLQENLTVALLAERAGMSERTFARSFHAETGSTPALFIEDLRVEAARTLLETSDLTVDAIARAVGYKHGKTLHRVIARRLSTTPDRYRQHFATGREAAEAV
ncbi:helix-turn-helix domain-containing protein [Nocardia sp. SYP-A9097]|uniref:GlxA family transcriptional regulator n=1 Tax=Nocardia sp. SYP-A9097 TaxID=2663237 RepID=UPI00129AE21B|nr:helix-turn-helix domain-containing protein [Nocardia sp. SYP-A9097]MRH90141.1 helix-turn-helix domain-containing protein [Nocardia sp. SYP-A9097]